MSRKLNDLSRKSSLPTWRIEQVQRLVLSTAQTSFAQMIRSEMIDRGWRYDPGNNEFTKFGICLYFSGEKGVFTRTGSDGRLSKICHTFSILPPK